MDEFADEFYFRNLMKRGFAGLATHEQKEEAQEVANSQKSRLYAIFQAWKYQIKENSLLKKYLSQAESQVEDQNEESISDIKMDNTIEGANAQSRTEGVI